MRPRMSIRSAIAAQALSLNVQSVDDVPSLGQHITLFEVRVDHRRLDVRMSQDLLQFVQGPSVCALHQRTAACSVHHSGAPAGKTGK